MPDEEYTVTQCTATGVIVRSTTAGVALPAVGNFIWNVPGTPVDDANLCKDCAQFGAVIESVGAPQDCSNGGDGACTQVELETRPALLSELFSDQMLETAGVLEFADKTMFEALGCGSGAGSRRLAGAFLPCHLIADETCVCD